MLEQVAVVAGDLDDERVRPELRRSTAVSTNRFACCDPGVAVRREVRVVVGEDRVGREVGRQLDEEAVVADADVERVERLGAVELVGREEILARRRHPEVDKRRRQGVTTESDMAVRSSWGPRHVDMSRAWVEPFRSP